jgi:hypothetical protein
MRVGRKYQILYPCVLEGFWERQTDKIIGTYKAMSLLDF